jgi:2-(1,2-epoxy-1,2-dihydrophenyl)acetyl-CoA isomerase
MSESEPSLLIDRGPVTRLTLNRPDKLNALNRELGNHLIEALETEGLRKDVRVLVIAGAGRGFCAGDDISGESSSADGADRSDPITYATLTHYYRFQHALRRVPKPVIAQIHGYCLGAGMDIVLGADYAVVDAEAKLGLVFAKRAIAAGMVLLPRYVGLKRATKLLFEADMFSAQEALELGLISRISKPGQLADDVAELAGRLAEGPTRVYGYIKEGLNRAYFPGLEEELRFMGLMQSFASRTQDATEARTAWRERRATEFRGI